MSNLGRRSIPLVRTLIVAGTLATVTPASADVVTDWNEKTVAYVNAAGRPAPAWILDLAMVHIAIHDAIQAYQHRFETYNDPIAGAAGSPVAAATAARDVLVNRFPAQAVTIHDAYLAYLGSKQLQTTDPGVSVGQEAALAIINRRSNDGAFPRIRRCSLVARTRASGDPPSRPFRRWRHRGWAKSRRSC
jgi:hypothetical protein